MAVVAGIDEAGYGPLLGPLVVSAVAFEVPDHSVGDDLWGRLADVVSRKPRDPARLPIDDSKRLYDRSRGPRHIERTALAFAAAAGHQTSSFRSFLDSVAELGESLGVYPWHAGDDFALPLAAGDATADVERLRKAASARFLGGRCIPVMVGEYNSLVADHGTKSATLFLKTARLLERFWRDWGERGLLVHVDKHGGRNRYGLLLHQTFFGARVRTLAEGPTTSLYMVTNGSRHMTVGFHEGGDARHLPVALASIFSKYLRELFMHGFNAWWCKRVPGLRPTAGYAVDARRFLAETASARQRLGISDHILVRIA